MGRADDILEALFDEPPTGSGKHRGADRFEARLEQLRSLPTGARHEALRRLAQSRGIPLVDDVAIRASGWHDWSRSQSTRRVSRVQPRSQRKLVAAVQGAVSTQHTIRPLGAGYSCSEASRPDEDATAIDTSRLRGELPVEGLASGIEGASLARFQAGTPLSDVVSILASRDQALANIGGFLGQTLAGALSTGTHGTGIALPPLCDLVASVDVVLVDAGGTAAVHRFEPTQGISDPERCPVPLHQDDDAFRAMVVSCGTLGVLSAITLHTVPMYWLREVGTDFSLFADFDARLKRASRGPVRRSWMVHPFAREDGDHDALQVEFQNVDSSRVPPDEWRSPPKPRSLPPLLRLVTELFGEQLVGTFFRLFRARASGFVDRMLDAGRGRFDRSAYHRVLPRPTADAVVARFAEVAVPIDRLRAFLETYLAALADLRRRTGEVLYAPLAVRFVGPSDHHLALTHGGARATVEAFVPRGAGDDSPLQLLHEVARKHQGRAHLGQQLPPWPQLPSYDHGDRFAEQWSLWNPRRVFDGPIRERLGLDDRKAILEATRALESGDEGEQLAALWEADDPRFIERIDPLIPKATATRAADTIWEDWLGGNLIPVARTEKALPDLDALRELVLQASAPQNLASLRVHGARHADSWVSRPHPGSWVINLDNWRDQPIRNESKHAPGDAQIRVWAWEKLGGVFDRLEAVGLAVINTGSFSGQSLGGPFSMATHGSGAKLGAMCDSVVAVDILCADGVVRRVARHDCMFAGDETVQMPGSLGSYQPLVLDIPFESAVVNLGCFGVVLSYALKVRKAYKLEQKVEQLSLDDALDQIEDVDGVTRHRHVELVLLPRAYGGKQVALITRNETTADGDGKQEIPAIAQMLQDHPGRVKIIAGLVQSSAPFRRAVLTGALKAQKDIVGTWRNVLIRDSGIAAHGFEIHFPHRHLRKGIDAVLEGIERARAAGVNPTAPMGVRFVAAGEQWMAMNHAELDGEPVDVWCTVEVPRLLGSKDWEVIPSRILARLEAVGVPYRCHWGQWFPTQAPQLPSKYPRLADWRAIRDAFDPERRFFPTLLDARLRPPTPRVALVTTDGQPASPPPRVPPGRRPRRVLCVHGIGDHHTDIGWREDWRERIVGAARDNGDPEPEIAFLMIDEAFESHALTPGQVAEALAELMGSVLRYHTSRSASRGWLADLERWWAWKPGMVAEWVANEVLRAELRTALHDAIVAFRPDVIAAHSLGSLVTYDTLTHHQTVPAFRCDLVTLGSQIAHPGIMRQWGGRLQKPASVDRWFHLFNPKDPVFTAPIAPARTIEVDSDGREDPHEATVYLGHPKARTEVWSAVLSQEDRTPLYFPAVLRTYGQRRKKAVLVGINQYADARLPPLSGCINDVYRMSALLQSRFGHEPADIRLLTDERATTDALREHLEWLLEGAGAGDDRLFYFSGHGAQLPAYNANELVDQVDECLVTHDFDWSTPHHAFVDDEFSKLYSQLDYGTRFTAVFDCCHSGGMSRAGIGGGVRGISAPHDVRHRTLRYQDGDWTGRSGLPARADAIRSKTTAPMRRSFPGAALGARMDKAAYDHQRAVRGHHGPYLPVLLYACSEDELAFEHVEGGQTFGAFTFALTQQLSSGPAQSYGQLLDGVRRRLTRIGAQQTPTIEGSKSVLSATGDPERPHTATFRF